MRRGASTIGIMRCNKGDKLRSVTDCLAAGWKIRYKNFLISRQYIATVYDHVAACLVGGSIACKVQVNALDLVDVALSAERCHTIGLVANTRCGTHFGVEEAR